jgi:hypothetical protein
MSVSAGRAIRLWLGEIIGRVFGTEKRGDLVALDRSDIIASNDAAADFRAPGRQQASAQRANDFPDAAREASVTPQCLSMTLLTCALVCSAGLHAQTTATMGPVALQGTVSSAQEAAMEGVLVSAKKPGSTVTTTVVTDEKGHYGFPASRLQPGHYDISIRASARWATG